MQQRCTTLDPDIRMDILPEQPLLVYARSAMHNIQVIARRAGSPRPGSHLTRFFQPRLRSCHLTRVRPSSAVVRASLATTADPLGRGPAVRCSPFQDLGPIITEKMRAAQSSPSLPHRVPRRLPVPPAREGAWMKPPDDHYHSAPRDVTYRVTCERSGRQ